MSKYIVMYLSYSQKIIEIKWLNMEKCKLPPDIT